MLLDLNMKIAKEPYDVLQEQIFTRRVDIMDASAE